MNVKKIIFIILCFLSTLYADRLRMIDFGGTKGFVNRNSFSFKDKKTINLSMVINSFLFIPQNTKGVADDAPFPRMNYDPAAFGGVSGGLGLQFNLGKVFFINFDATVGGGFAGSQYRDIEDKKSYKWVTGFAGVGTGSLGFFIGRDPVKRGLIRAGVNAFFASGIMNWNISVHPVVSGGFSF